MTETLAPSAPLAELAGLLPTGRLVHDAADLEPFRRDEAVWCDVGTPLAAVLARSREDVVAVMRWATQHRVPVVVRGAGSGLAGGANAVDGGLVLDVSGLDRVVEVDAAARVAVVGAGVINADLKAAAHAEGLWYPPDPASYEWATVGGNVATNAGGLCCVRYGVTRDYVLALEAVLADGRVLRAGRRTAKGVTGYDLVGLLVGSEGTLAVITEVTVRLVPPPAPVTTLVAAFPDAASAAAGAALLAAAMPVSLLELMDRTTLDAVQAHQPIGLEPEWGALLLAQVDRGGEPGRAEAALEAAAPSFCYATDDDAEAADLLAARRLALPALQKLGPAFLDDVCVPLPALAALIEGIQRIGRDRGVTIGTFGHAGDGNMHPTIVMPAGSEDAAQGAFRDLLELSLSLGGTLTGEHGVGLLKAPFLADELSPVSRQLQGAVKDAWDPLGLLNPGKALA